MQQRGHVLLESRGVSLLVRTEGHGSPVVFLHGGPGADHSTMLSLLPLAAGHRLVFYDHRCNGRSRGAGVTTMTWENITADLEALRIALQIDQWAVVGHSFGGMVALEYALRYPRSLTHLCILDSGASGRSIAETAVQSLQQDGYGRLTVATARRFFRG